MGYWFKVMKRIAGGSELPEIHHADSERKAKHIRKGILRAGATNIVSVSPIFRHGRADLPSMAEFYGTKTVLREVKRNAR